MTLRFARHGSEDQSLIDPSSSEGDLNPQRPMIRTIHYYRGMSSDSYTSSVERSRSEEHGKQGLGSSPVRTPLSTRQSDKCSDSALAISAAEQKPCQLGSSITHFYEVRKKRHQELKSKAADLKNRLRASGFLIGDLVADGDNDSESTNSEPCTPRSPVETEPDSYQGDREVGALLGKLHGTCGELEDLTTSLQSAVFDLSVGSLKQSADKNLQTEPYEDEALKIKILDLQKLLRKKDEEVEEVRAQLRSKEDGKQVAEERLRRKDEEVIEVRSQLQWREEVVEEVRSQLRSKEARIQEVEERLRWKDEEVIEVRSQLRSKKNGMQEALELLRRKEKECEVVCMLPLPTGGLKKFAGDKTRSAGKEKRASYSVFPMEVHDADPLWICNGLGFPRPPLTGAQLGGRQRIPALRVWLCILTDWNS